MSIALINPSILKWARLRKKIDINRLALSLHVKSEKIASWENGESRPTFKQAQNAANALKIPFGFLYLSEPPKEELLIPDLRTVNNKSPGDYSADLRDTIVDVIRKQDWYKDYLIEQGKGELDFVKKYNSKTPNHMITNDIVNVLGMKMEDRYSSNTDIDYYNLLREKAEKVGIWILKNGKVGSNTNRTLSVNEFRGFVICDPIAPVIFINGVDAKAAQIFTLAHEIAHIWIGQSGVSDANLLQIGDTSQFSIEEKCNQIAADILVPQNDIVKMWNKKKSVDENAVEFKKIFKVSAIVLARRALDLSLISKNAFFSYYNEQVELWAAEKNKKSGGGDFYNNLPSMSGKNFLRSLLISVYTERTLVRDGARLLGVSASTLETYAKNEGII